MLKKSTTGLDVAVRHFYLDKTLKIDLPENNFRDCYGTFYWKNINLGECYLKAGSVKEPMAIRAMIWNAISAGISNFQPDEIGFKMLQAAFLSEDKMWFEEEMEKLFFKSPGNPDGLNTGVPAYLFVQNNLSELYYTF